ncbi:hypothetical protein RDABS01_019447, partial [Bienertia sinuspersici]
AFAKAWEAVCGAKLQNVILQVPNGKTFLVKPLKFQGPCKSTTINIQTIWFVYCNKLALQRLKFFNSSGNHISIKNSNNVLVSHLHIQAPGDTPNTDGIDISYSSGISIFKSVIATGDDCVAMSNGSHDIKITSVTCGPGHGIREVKDMLEISSMMILGSIMLQIPLLLTIKISDVSFTRMSGTSYSEKAIVLHCSQTIGCTNIQIEQADITSSIPRGKTVSDCFNAHVKPPHSKNVPSTNNCV